MSPTQQTIHDFLNLAECYKVEIFDELGFKPTQIHYSQIMKSFFDYVKDNGKMDHLRKAIDNLKLK